MAAGTLKRLPISTSAQRNLTLLISGPLASARPFIDLHVAIIAMGKQGKGKKPKEHKVLADHRRVGKRFIPSFLDLGKFRDTSWIDNGVPELLWIGLLINRFGLTKGSELALSLGKAAMECARRSPKVLFAGTTAFTDLTTSEAECVVARLSVAQTLSDLRFALRPLIALYPTCPLKFLFSAGAPRFSDPASDVAELSGVVSALLDRHSKESTLTASGAVYIAFVTDILRVHEGLALANFPTVAKYPDSEESQQVGASVRATAIIFLAMLRESKGSDWPRYFWNRGMDIQPCVLPRADLEY